MNEDEYFVERTLTIIPECFVFKLPPRMSSSGYLASEMKERIWSGCLKVVQKDKEGHVLLLNRTDDSLFAMSRIKEGSVDKVRDSSRYFVLKIENSSGRHAFIGLAFNDRNASFDFNVAIQEYFKDMRREDTISMTTPSQLNETSNYALRDGEKIQINFSTKTRKRPQAASAGGRTTAAFLAPPPRDTPPVRKGHGSENCSNVSYDSSAVHHQIYEQIQIPSNYIPVTEAPNSQFYYVPQYGPPTWTQVQPSDGYYPPHDVFRPSEYTAMHQHHQQMREYRADVPPFSPSPPFHPLTSRITIESSTQPIETDTLAHSNQYTVGYGENVNMSNQPNSVDASKVRILHSKPVRKVPSAKKI